jgi:hypothetical protein
MQIQHFFDKRTSTLTYVIHDEFPCAAGFFHHPELQPAIALVSQRAFLRRPTARL